MRRDTHQGDCQQRAAHSYKLQSRGTLPSEKADGNRNCSRGDAGDRRHADCHGAGRKSTVEQHQPDDTRHPGQTAPRKANQRDPARMSPPDRSRAAACSPAFDSHTTGSACTLGRLAAREVADTPDESRQDGDGDVQHPGTLMPGAAGLVNQPIGPSLDRLPGRQSPMLRRENSAVDRARNEPS